jgi:tight adherence protein C
MSFITALIHHKEAEMGSSDFAGSLTLFGALGLAAFSVYSFVSSLLSGNNDKDLLSWATGQEPVKSKSQIINGFRPLVHNFTLKHALKIKNQRHRKQVEFLIRTGGLGRELNVDEFIGFQILLGLMIPALLTVGNFALAMGIPWLAVIGLAVGGWQFPMIYARSEKTRRENEARRDLPFFADLMALSTEAGLDFLAAMQRIVEKADSKSTLADEMANVIKDQKMGASRSDALKGLAKRLDCQEIMSFVAVIVDADATGASIAQVLKDQSVQIRLERFVRAEKAGARASQMMIIPMLLFILPAFFMVVMGPVFLNMFYGGK